MPKASKISPQEKDEIAQIAAKMTVLNPQITKQEVGEVVKRSRQTVMKAMSDELFETYKTEFKKKIDSVRLKAINEADKRILKAVKSDKVNAYQLVGMSKTFYEQVYDLNSGNNINVSGNQMAVQVVRGNVSYNNNKEEEPETQA